MRDERTRTGSGGPVSMLLLHDFYPAEESTLEPLRRRLGTAALLAGAAPGRAHEIELAACEAARNVVQHAYEGEEEGEIFLSAMLVGDSLYVLVADDGCGLGNSAHPGGQGVGQLVMMECSDGLTIAEQLTGGVEVQLRFDLERR